MDVLYYNAFIKISYKREDLAPQKEAIYGFTNTATSIPSAISLKTSIGSKKGRVRCTTLFVVFEVESSFNAILGCPFIHNIRVVPSAYHRCIRYLDNGTIAIV